LALRDGGAGPGGLAELCPGCPSVPDVRLFGPQVLKRPGLHVFECDAFDSPWQSSLENINYARYIKFLKIPNGFVFMYCFFSILLWCQRKLKKEKRKIGLI